MQSNAKLRIVTTVDGASLLMLNGYSFANPVPVPGGERWYCSGTVKWNCNVCLHVNDDYELVCISHEHTHSPPVYERRDDELTYSVIPSRTGKRSLIQFRNYTFAQINKDIRYWYCSEKLKMKCQAKIKINGGGGEIISFDDTHNHQPPQYYRTDDEDEQISEEYLEIFQDNELDDYSGDDVAVFVESRKGKTILQLNGHRYRKIYRSKHGVRWKCSVNKQCNAFVCLNDNDEIIIANQDHSHSRARVDTVDGDQNDTAVVITSRKGREMLLFRQYTYRKQYTSQKGGKARWVCSTMKNCRGCVFTDGDNFITSSFEEHTHPPPKYYLKPDNVIGALREPLVNESE